MNTKEERKFIKAIVAKYLFNKPELEYLRDEFINEGSIAYYNYRHKWSSSKGTDKKLYLTYKIIHSLQHYLRREVKHFKKPFRPEDPNGESQYWDLEDTPDINEIPIEAKEYEGDSIINILSNTKVSLATSEKVIAYLKCGSYTQVAKDLGISKQAVEQAIKRFINKVKEDNNSKNS